MKINSIGLNLIKQFEGCSLKPYADAVGVPTIGYGCTTYEDGTKVSLSDAPISQERADELLRFQVSRFEKEVSDMFDIALTQNQFNALVSFAFNLGSSSLRNSTLRQCIINNDFDSAAAEFVRWRFAAKKPLRGLLRRRLAEATLFTID